MYIYVHVYIDGYIYTHTHTCTCVYRWICIYTHIYMYMCRYVYICAIIYKQMIIGLVELNSPLLFTMIGHSILIQMMNFHPEEGLLIYEVESIPL